MVIFSILSDIAYASDGQLLMRVTPIVNPLMQHRSCTELVWFSGQAPSSSVDPTQHQKALPSLRKHNTHLIHARTVAVDGMSKAAPRALFRMATDKVSLSRDVDVTVFAGDM